MVEKLSGSGWIGLRVSAPARKQASQSSVFGAMMSLLTFFASSLFLFTSYLQSIREGDLFSRISCCQVLLIVGVALFMLQVPPWRIKILFKEDTPLLQRIGRTYALLFLWCVGLVGIAVLPPFLDRDLNATLRPFFFGWFFGLPVLFGPTLVQILARLLSGSEVRIDLDQRKIYYFVREDLFASGTASLEEVQGVALKYIDPYWEVWLKLPEYNNIRILYTSDPALAQEFCTQLESLIQQAQSST